MQVLDYLRELISFPSISSVSNVAVTDCVEQWLRQMHFETERISYQDARGVLKTSVVARRGPQSGSGLAWFGHTDVVPVDSWSYPQAGPWQADVVDGRVYGRGSCDMKGPVACMLAAVARIPAEQQHAPLWFVATADEEVGMLGARSVAAQSQLYRQIVAQSAGAIIGEPTSLRVVYSHKGGRTVQAVSRGRAAHSSTGLGQNACMALIPFLEEIRRINDELETQPQWRDERFQPPTPTLNLLLHDVNTGINITSPLASCQAYFRPMPGQPADELTERMRSVAVRCGLQFEITFASDPLYTDPHSPFIQELLQISGRDTAETVAYGTDGAVLTELQSMAVWGPGDIAQAHTDDEWISLQQLELGTMLYEQAIRRWCC
ncbi:MAG TPA: acetylornithine deacetylase [Planctomycetaceae bacterium]|nr:acetylornithine deacetylase [Planctomycetaceae bacterium]